MSKRLVVLLAASLAAGLCFAADDPGNPNGGDPNGGAPKEKSVKQAVSSSVKPSEKPVPRVWIGLTGSYTPLKLIKANNSGNITDPGGDTFTAKAAQGQAGGGAIVNIRLIKGFGISLGAIYRFTGYDATEDTNPANSAIGDTFENIERTRVRLLDIPVMVRYSGKKFNPSKHTFYELGGVMRGQIPGYRLLQLLADHPDRRAVSAGHMVWGCDHEPFRASCVCRGHWQHNRRLQRVLYVSLLRV